MENVFSKQEMTNFGALVAWYTRSYRKLVELGKVRDIGEELPTGVPGADATIAEDVYDLVCDNHIRLDHTPSVNNFCCDFDLEGYLEARYPLRKTYRVELTYRFTVPVEIEAEDEEMAEAMARDLYEYDHSQACEDAGEDADYELSDVDVEEV